MLEINVTRSSLDQMLGILDEGNEIVLGPTKPEVPDNLK